jgi:hypothetical protein
MCKRGLNCLMKPRNLKKIRKLTLHAHKLVWVNLFESRQSVSNQEQKQAWDSQGTRQ